MWYWATMKNNLFLWNFCLCCCMAAADIQMENNVLLLDPNNFYEAVSTYDYLLVNFYAPWCSYCKSLSPVYDKAASLLKGYNSRITLAKVNAVDHYDLAVANGFGGYPTLTFFRFGQPMHYDGGRTVKSIISWVQNRLNTNGQSMLEQEDLKNLVQTTFGGNDIIVAGYYNKKIQKSAAVLKSTLKFMEDQNLSYTFGVASQPDTTALHNISKTTLFVFKSFIDTDVDVMKKYLELEGFVNFINYKSYSFVVSATIIVTPILYMF